MIQACIDVLPPYQDNQIFNLSNLTLNRDNCLLGFYLLKQEFANDGVNLSTSDITPPDDSSIVIYIDIPKIMPNRRDKAKSHLLLFESEVIRPDNWNLKKHEYFNKIFTWNDVFVDNIKYFKINFSNNLPALLNLNISRKKKLCTLIAGNKVVRHPLELYSKRIEAIRWFERNQPTTFDLYGIGWGEYNFTGPRRIRALNKIKPLTRLLAPNFSSYQGVVREKITTLEKYKFCICYENVRDVPGYITEKIFDCFVAGCVPIYWGASNIDEYIPKNCFIDKRYFYNYASLYEFINTIDENIYLEYLNNIENFINGENSYQFSHEYFIKTVTTTLLNK